MSGWLLDADVISAWAPGSAAQAFPGALAGSWHLQRTIDNGAAMMGTATISPWRDGQYGYHEQGHLRLADGQVVGAERRYLFKECEGGFLVLFVESPPRLFHRVILHKIGTSLVGTGVHLCREDRYDSRYEFHPDGSFVVRHTVRGPRKRYAMSTRYSRDSRQIGAVAITTSPA